MHRVYGARIDDRTGYVVHETGKIPGLQFIAVCGSISWPTITTPGAYVVLGKSAFENTAGEYPVELLAEGRFDDLDDLLQALTDAAVLNLADDIFADVHRPIATKDGMSRQDDDAYWDAFHDFCRENDVSGVTLCRAPWVDNFEYGLTLIQKKIKAQALLDFEGTALAKELGSIPREELGEDPGKTYPLVNALRFALGGLEKQGGGVKITAEKARELYEQYAPPPPVSM